MRHLALCGLMGVGKTAVGEIAASRLGRPLRDNDAGLRRLMGTTAADIERRFGVGELHRLEATVLAHDVQHTTPSVVTAAASTITNAEISRLLRRTSYVVWLDVDPATAAERMIGGRHRPVRGRGTSDLVAWVAALRAERAPWFRAVADLTVDAASAAPPALAAMIIDRFNLATGHAS